MDFEIKPLQGAGPLRFGMSVAEVRDQLGENFKSFKKTPSSAFPCDHFPDLQIFAYYKIPGVLEALEFYDTANPLLNDQQLIGVAAGVAKKILERFDQALEFDSDDIISHSLGIGIYAPGWDTEITEIVEGIIVFEEGYY